jgi:hypothetical protein
MNDRPRPSSSSSSYSRDWDRTYLSGHVAHRRDPGNPVFETQTLAQAQSLEYETRTKDEDDRLLLTAYRSLLTSSNGNTEPAEEHANATERREGTEPTDVGHRQQVQRTAEDEHANKEK